MSDYYVFLKALALITFTWTGLHGWQMVHQWAISRASNQGAKKVIFTACHSGKLKLTFTSPNVISTSPKNVLISRLISQFFCNLNSSKNFTCLSGKLRTEFTSPIANPLAPGYRTLLSLHTVVTPFQHPLKLKCRMSWSFNCVAVAVTVTLDFVRYAEYQPLFQ